MKQLVIESIPTLPYRTREAINRLRVNLSYCGEQYKTILLTSSVPGEGKSYVTFHLWRALAQTGKNVLLIDADIRRSTMRTQYHITTKQQVPAGLVSYMAGQSQLENVVYSTNIACGYMVPLFRNMSNPSLLLANPKFGEMIRTLKPQFDYILIDTPPLDSVSDALQIAPFADGALLVVQGGSTPRKIVSASLKQLAGANCTVLGTVLNQVEENMGSYYYRQSRYNY